MFSREEIPRALARVSRSTTGAPRMYKGSPPVERS